MGTGPASASQGCHHALQRIALSTSVQLSSIPVTGQWTRLTDQHQQWDESASRVVITAREADVQGAYQHSLAGRAGGDRLGAVGQCAFADGAAEAGRSVRG